MKRFVSILLVLAMVMALAPMTRYLWRVRLWDEQGECGVWSEEASFETARYDLPWQAKWIKLAMILPSSSLKDRTVILGSRGPQGF